MPDYYFQSIEAKWPNLRRAQPQTIIITRVVMSQSMVIPLLHAYRDRGEHPIPLIFEEYTAIHTDALILTRTQPANSLVTVNVFHHVS